MSYSISVRAATKALALAALAASFDQNVLANQPVHAADKVQALAAAEAITNILPDDEGKDVSISMNGSLSWTGTLGESPSFCGASVNVSAYLEAKAVAA